MEAQEELIPTAIVEPPSVLRWRTILAVPIAAAFALALHALIAKNEPLLEAHSYRLLFIEVIAVAIVLAAVYYGVFIFKTSFLLNGERYFCLYDDAMISMRYAKNLAQGLDSSGTPGASALKGLRIPYGFSSWPDYMSPRSRRPR